MSAQHTPGPWTVDYNCTSVIIGADDTEVATVESDADARLIAAAPDLLAQADHNKRIRDGLVELFRKDGWAEDCTLINQLTCMNFSAITKAEGRDKA